ncbi:hypothetical protein ACTK62_005053, partial [Escherichia coli]
SDVEKLSPLQCGHINMQGRYSFTVPESVNKGELRAFIDRNLNPKKIKKTPKNGCLFNTACVP